MREELELSIGIKMLSPIHTPLAGWRAGKFDNEIWPRFFEKAKNPIRVLMKVKVKEEFSYPIFSGNKEDYDHKKAAKKRDAAMKDGGFYALTELGGKIQQARFMASGGHLKFTLVLLDADEGAE